MTRRTQIVLHMATADDLPSVKSILKGLSRRDSSKPPVIYIHTSGSESTSSRRRRTATLLTAPHLRPPSFAFQLAFSRFRRTLTTLSSTTRTQQSLIDSFPKTHLTARST